MASDSWLRRGTVAALVVAAALAGVVAFVPQRQAVGLDCDALTRKSSTGAGPVVRVVGDSYTDGFGVEPEEAWPAYIGRGHRVVVNGLGGSGFVASPCPREAFADRVSGAASLVVVQGGLNDWLTPSREVAQAARRTIAAADGPLVIVGPPAAPAREAGARRIDRVLARVAAADGVDYVSTIGLDLPYLPDQLHLTAAGHRQFGRYVARAIGALS